MALFSNNFHEGGTIPGPQAVRGMGAFPYTGSACLSVLVLRFSGAFCAPASTAWSKQRASLFERTHTAA